MTIGTHDTASVPTTRRWWALTVLCLSVLLVVVDNTIVNVALPTLSAQLHASTSGLQWLVDAYSLVFAGLLLVGGGLGDRFGRCCSSVWCCSRRPRCGRRVPPPPTVLSRPGRVWVLPRRWSTRQPWPC